MRAPRLWRRLATADVVELRGAASQMLDGLEELVEALRVLGTRTPQIETVHEAHVLGLGSSGDMHNYDSF